MRILKGFLTIRNSFLTSAVCALWLCTIFMPDAGDRQGLSPAGLCEAAEGAGVSGLDSRQQRAAIEEELAKARGSLSQGKLQDARAAVGVLEQSKKNLPPTEAASLNAKIDKIKNAIAFKEDSLVNVNISILRTQGADSAFQFMQTVVWAHGVAKDKIDFIENTILNEAPAVGQNQEHEAIARTVQQVESNAPVDSSVDPYILKTAQMLVQTRTADSRRPTAPGTAAGEKTPVTAQPARDVVQMAPIAEPEPTPEPQPQEQPPAPKPAPAETQPLPANPAPAQEQAALAAPETSIPAAAPPAAAPISRPAPQKSGAGTKKPEEYQSPSLQAVAKSTQDFITKLKASQEAAQQAVMELYTMVESGQGTNALVKFKTEREFIAKYVDPQAFNVLELTVVQSAIDQQAPAAAPTAQPSMKPIAPEQGYIDHINALTRDNRVEAAYAEFKRVEPRLNRFMTKKEFTLLKDMIENAYKVRKEGK